jgi:hypothetical protein
MSKLLYQRKCLFCGKEFTASRIDAKYCSTQCGQKAYQQLKRENNPDEVLSTEKNLGANLGAVTPQPPQQTKIQQEEKQVPKKNELYSRLFGDISPKSEREMQKELIKEAFRELFDEQFKKQQTQTNVTVKHQDTSASWLNIAATGLGIAFNKSDNNDIKQTLQKIINNQNTIVQNQQSIFKLINSTLMDVKALKRVCKIFHITTEYSPKYKSYLFCYRDGNYIVKEDVNGNIIEQIPIPKK